MSNGSKTPPRQSQLPAEPCEKRLGMLCLRCEGTELVDCDLCVDGHEECPGCEGLGLMVCPACDGPPDAPLPAGPTSLERCPSVDSACRLSATSVTPVSSARHSRARSTPEKLPPLLGPPERTGAAGCGERLRWARQRLSLSMEQLAKTSGYSPRSLGSYERGQTLGGPPVKAIEDLAQALGVRRSWLAFGLGSVETTQRPHRAQTSAQTHAT